MHFCGTIGEKYREVVQKFAAGSDDARRWLFARCESFIWGAIQQEKSDMRELSTKMKQLRKEDVDYYTLWAHQIKTSIAASQLLIRELPQTSEKSLLESRTCSDYDLYSRTSTALRSNGKFPSRLIDFNDFYRWGWFVRSWRNTQPSLFRRNCILDYVPTEKKVVTDLKWLGVIVEQVLSNAVKYTPEGMERFVFFWRRYVNDWRYRESGLPLRY